MKLLIEELEQKPSKYRVIVRGISDKFESRYYYTYAVSDKQAIATVVSKMLREADTRPTMRNWVYQDGKIKIPVNSRYKGLMISYLQANPHLVQVQRMIGK